MITTTLFEQIAILSDLSVTRTRILKRNDNQKEIDMQPMTKEEVELLIAEAKAEGKDTTGLEEQLAQPAPLMEPKLGETIKVGKRWIMSTGPAREEDFE